MMEYNYKVKAFEFIEKAEKLLLGKLNREFKSFISISAIEKTLKRGKGICSRYNIGYITIIHIA